MCRLGGTICIASRVVSISTICIYTATPKKMATKASNSGSALYTNTRPPTKHNMHPVCNIMQHLFCRCRFGGLVVLATRLSPSEIQCYAPPFEAGTYPLELSLNNQDYTNQRFPFLYFDDQVTLMIMGGASFSPSPWVWSSGLVFARVVSRCHHTPY